MLICNAPFLRYELPLLAEDALTFLEPSGQKKLMEVLDETLDVIRSVANEESSIIERTTVKDEVSIVNRQLFIQGSTLFRRECDIYC